MSLGQKIQEILNEQMKHSSIDVVALPSQGDRMTKLRTLEAILEDFEAQNADEASDAVGYFVTVKTDSPKPLAAPQAAAISSELQKPALESIYLTDGKLNLAFLIQNAELLFATGEYTLARNIFKTIYQAGERAASALLGIARCFEAEGKFEEAQLHYEESVAYQATLEALQRLGSILVQQKKDLQAAAVFDRALALKDLAPRLRFELHQASGNCFSRAKKFEEAQRHFLKALAIDPAADEIRSNLGANCLHAGKTGEARKHFQDAVASNPKNAKAFLGLAQVYLEQGEKREAHDTFAKALDQELQHPTAIFHLVKLAYELRSYVTAARIVENYIEVAPININLLYSLAGLQYHLSRGADAAGTAQKILTLNPDHHGAKDLLTKIAL